jgi:hypothetical protein
LGFYSDDWDFLTSFSESQDQSIIGLFKSCYVPHVAMRPVQVLYFSVLYWLFGPQPIGYHLINAMVFLSSVILFYLTLRELDQQRIFTLAVPLIYALLPNYSTDRFWFAASQANLSMTLYFLSLYSGLRALRTSAFGLMGWQLLSILSLLGSTLAYEVVIPLFFLNLLVVWYHGKQPYYLNSKLSIHKIRAALLAGNLLTLIAVLAFKALTTTRLDKRPIMERIYWTVKRAVVPVNSQDYDYGLNFNQAISVNYGDYGIGLPRIVWKILNDYPDVAIFVLGGVVGFVIFVYLYRSTGKYVTEQLNKINMMRLIAWGVVIFGLGYAIFLTNENILITSTGIGNRVNIAAAAGVALSIVGAIGFISSFLPSDRLRQFSFYTLLALFCFGGFVVNNTLASFWIAAYQQQKLIMVDMDKQISNIPEGSTIILDGICPYVGPGIVFESSWDLRGAMRIRYHNKTLRADVVTPNLKIRKDGLYTSLYGREHYYPYKKLIVYNSEKKKIFQLSDANAARSYFSTFNPDLSSGCPHGSGGIGVPIF